MNRSVTSLQCEESLKSKESLENYRSLEEFLQILIDLKVYSTIDFINLKNEKDLPDGVPDKPLQAYPELEGKWSVLWKKIRDIRFPYPQEQEDTIKRRKLNSEELRAFMMETFNEWEEQEKLKKKKRSREEERLKEKERLRKEKRNEQILLLMMENPYITTVQLAKQTGATITTINNAIADLKNKGRVTNIKINNSGLEYWRILPTKKKPSRRFLQREREEKILFLMDMNPYITMVQIAERMGTATSTITNVITRLKTEGRVTRIGMTQKGYWKILQMREEPSDYSLQEERKRQILRLMFANPHITILNLAEQINLSRPTVQTMIARLKTEGRVARTGAASRSGYWEVLLVGEGPSGRDPKEERKNTIWEMMRDNPYITIAQLAEQTDFSQSIIGYVISELKGENRLKRIGSSNIGFGYWEALQMGKEPSGRNLQEERKNTIWEMMKDNPQITFIQMAEQIGVAITTINSAIADLKSEKRLVRIGAASRSGYWEVLLVGEGPSGRDPKEERKNTIWKLMRDNPQITLTQMAEQMGLAISTIRRMITSLQQEGRVARIGAERNGYWQARQEGVEPSYFNPQEERKNTIWKLMRDNPYITIAQLAEQTDFSQSIINYVIAKLKEEKRLVRIGARDTGYWEALQVGEEPSGRNPQEERKNTIWEMMRDNPYITIAQLMEQTGAGRATINSAIAGLKNEGRVTRIGAKKNGYWETLQEGEKPSGHSPREERQNQFLSLIRENPQITRAQITEQTGIPKATTNKTIADLEEEGRLVRIRNNRRWKIPQNEADTL